MRGVEIGFAGLLAMVGIYGCGDGSVLTPFGNESGTSDETMADPTAVDTTTGGDGSDSEETGVETTDSGGGGQGDPCTEHSDCNGWCWDPDGDGDGICVEPCSDDCPAGFFCAEVPVDGMPQQLCVPIPNTFCDPCTSSDHCGGPEELCIPLNGGGFCSINCAGNPDICPVGFGCGLIGEVGDGELLLQCVPDNGICCVDADGDIYGEGGGCYDEDCDDTNPAVHDSHEEICDGFDNDCNGQVDDMVTDCTASSCELGGLGYFEDPGEVCTDGECVGDPTGLCGLYTCSEGEEEGDACAVLCDGEDNLKCIPPAHCDDSVCYEDLPDGQPCDEVSDCESDHCQNGFCCAFGDCCQVARDCPTFGTQDPICISPTTCQGTQGEAVCAGTSICSNTGIVADDSACDPATEASDCGYYLSVFCTGEVDQDPPLCATDCDSDADCDENAYCDPLTATCEADLTNGSECMGVSWCISDHCQNGFCCDGGDCCAAETDCPASYSGPPVCTSPATCQGERDVAVCNSNACETATGVADDSACVPGPPASECGPYPSVFCTGGSVQNPPQCPDSCTADIECDTSAYCSSAGVCVPDEPDGDDCTSASQCISGHCQNGFCCESGDCCANSGDCGDYDESPVCDNSSTCQGTRVDGVCNGTFQCTADTVNDDSACVGIEASDCGPYPSVSCSGSLNQRPPVCPDDCSGDGECDASAHCENNECVPDEGQGGFCTSTSQCASGLSCVDNVCCSSACTGSCEACDVAGSEGTCTTIPAGEDPDNECGAIACDAYFDGWQGDDCYDRADVSAGAAGCSGGGSCYTAADLCPSQGPGSVVEACHANCQAPNTFTCVGQTPPMCVDVNPGSNTCGLGVCENTMAQCQNGAPQACMPNTSAAGPEVCNDLDDNCDGSVDVGSFGDTFEPNGSCGAISNLDEVGSDETVTYNTQTIYAAGDNDYYYIHVEETDSQCECCNLFCTDEDYRVWIWLTVPPGAGSYFLCSNTGCSFGAGNCTEVLAGNTANHVFTFDGGCPGGDDYDIYVRVYGDNAPAHECLPYTLQYRMEPGCY